MARPFPDPQSSANRVTRLSHRFATSTLARSRPTHVLRSAILLSALTVATQSSANAQLAGVAGVGATIPVTIGPFELTHDATVDRIGSPVGPRTVLNAHSALSLPVWDGGVRLAVGARRAREVDSVAAYPSLAGALWRNVGRVTLELTTTSQMARFAGRASTVHVHTFYDSVRTDTGMVGRLHADTTGEPGTRAHSSPWSELEMRASWTGRATTITGAVGTRPAVERYPRAAWARVTGAVRLNNTLALVLGAGMVPADITLGLPSSHIATIALRAAPVRHTSDRSSPATASPARFLISATGPHQYRISYVATGPRSIELAGDFDSWTPVALEQVRPGVWQTTLALPPGTYHMSIRVDGGAWGAPPGTAAVTDDFNGTSGVVIVPDA